MISGGPGPHPQLLDHRPHRPRQVDAGRSHPRAHPDGGGARMRAQVLDSMELERERGITIKAQAVRVLFEARTGRPTSSSSSTPRATWTSPTRSRARSPRARGRCWSSTPRRASRRRPGQHLPGHRRRPRAHPVPEQDRPARAPSPSEVAAEVGELLGERPGRRTAHLGQDRGGRRRRARGARGSGFRRPTATRRAAARADLRLRVRPVPRRHRLHARGRRQLHARARRSARCRPAPRPTSTTSASSPRA